MKTIHNEKDNQITFLDERFYLDTETDEYQPSVTTILSVYPKGFGYIQWLKDLGANTDEVLRRTAESGSRVHDAIDRLLFGEELKWVEGDKQYNLREWLMVLRFYNFYKEYKPEVLVHEKDMVSSDLGYGGTIDLICRIKDKVWLIDYKTGNGIYKSHYLQLSAYRELWNTGLDPTRIDKVGVLWLNAKTRGKDKSGRVMQDEGWRVVEPKDDHEKLYRLFKNTHDIWLEENPNPKPKNRIYPDTLKLKVREQV